MGGWKEGLLRDLNGLINYFGGSFVTERCSLIGLMTSDPQLVATLSTFVEIPQWFIALSFDTSIMFKFNCTYKITTGRNKK